MGLPPKPSILVGFSMINHLLLGTAILGNPHIEKGMNTTTTTGSFPAAAEAVALLIFQVLAAFWCDRLEYFR